MDGAGAYAGRGGPRDRTAERPVDLDRRRVELEARACPRGDPAGHVGAGRAGRRRAGGRRRRRRPRARAAYDVAVGGAHAASARPSRTSIRVDLGAAADRRRRGPSKPARQRPGSARRRRPRGRGSRRSGPSIVMSRPISPGAGGVEGDVGVPGVAREQQPGRLAAEALAPPARPPGSAASARSRGRRRAGARARQPDAGADRRERRQQAPTRCVADAVPLRAQLQPRLAVAGVQLVERRP